MLMKSWAIDNKESQLSALENTITDESFWSKIYIVIEIKYCMYFFHVFMDYTNVI